MATVVVTASLRSEVPLAAGEIEVDAVDVFGLVRQLEASHPGLREFIEAQVSIAIDGALVSDWSTPLRPDSEVLLVPHIAGG